jgi:hypothetical protein
VPSLLVQRDSAATGSAAIADRVNAGIEALVWLTDIAGLTRDEAVELMRWSAAALLRSTLADHLRQKGEPT